MALITVSGLPSSGRSRRSQQMKDDFEARIQASPSSAPSRVVIVSDQDTHVSRSAYASQRTEKPARASYLSAVTRALGRDTIVIADGGAGLNIKGFRYQLWCAAREVGVRCLTVHVHAPPALCRRWNAERRQEHGDGVGYDDETLDSLCMRYEEPNAMTRWDSPLFLVPSILDPNGSGSVQSDPLPLDDIWDAATRGAIKKAPEVVAPTRSTTSSYLTQLESSTQSVVTLLLEHQASFGADPGSTIPLNVSGGKQIPLQLPGDKAISMAALQRLRRHFIRMHSAGSAAINELGIAARQEGVQFNLSQGTHKPSATNVDKNPSPEWLIANRFVAFLEASL